MGIYDRDYIRNRQPPRGYSGGISAMRMWTVNTWLIVICVGFFAVDHYFAPAASRRPVVVSETLPAGVTPKEVVTNSSRYQTRPTQDPSTVVVVDIVQDQEIGTISWAMMPPLQRWLHFSTALTFLQPLQAFDFWRFIGFQFLHASMPHLLFNMIALYFFGSLVERSLGGKRYLAFYLLCGICGALMYLLLNLSGYIVARVFQGPAFIPGLLFNSPHTPLVGASAGVFGVLMAGAYLAPRSIVLLFFILPMQLKTLAYALVVLALITVVAGGVNAGGEAGHLGGALAGFYFIRHPHHLHGFFDIIGRIDPTSHHYRTGRTSKREIDRILDKINKRGIHSLSQREKKVLREASEN